jgi:hypothetical protein
LRVAGVDAVDGTPVYDVKPYLPWAESIPDAKADWAPQPPSVTADEAVVIPPNIAEQLGASTTRLIRQLLRLQLKPAYQDAQSRTYGMTVSGWNVRWQTLPGGRVVVCEVEQV